MLFFCEKEHLSFPWDALFLKLFIHIYPLSEILLSNQVKIKQTLIKHKFKNS